MTDQVFAIDQASVERAKEIVLGHPRLSARDALHLAVMEQHEIERILSFDSGGNLACTVVSSGFCRLTVGTTLIGGTAQPNQESRAVARNTVFALVIQTHSRLLRPVTAHLCEEARRLRRFSKMMKQNSQPGLVFPRTAQRPIIF